MSAIKCKAAVLWGPRQKLSIEEIEVAPPRKDEVRIKILTTCPCHTDLTIFHGKGLGPYGHDFPVILGHEACGVIESVGEGVNELAPGDLVVPTPQPICRNCDECKLPNSNTCTYFTENHAKGLMPDGTTRFTCKGQRVYHFLAISTFSEYTVTSIACVAKLISEVPKDVASLFGCCFTTGYGTVVNAAKVPTGATTAVFGLGAVGLSAVVGLKECGASKIIAVDVDDGKFEMAKKLGATHFINPKTYNGDVVTVIEKMNGGKGLDFTFECAGTQETMIQSLKACHSGFGVNFMVGSLPFGETLTVDPFDIITGRTWRGSIDGGVKMRDWIPEALQKFKNVGSFPMKELITHRFKLDKINEAIEAMTHGGIRVAIEMATNDG